MMSEFWDALGAGKKKKPVKIQIKKDAPKKKPVQLVSKAAPMKKPVQFGPKETLKKPVKHVNKSDVNVQNWMNNNSNAGKTKLIPSPFSNDSVASDGGTYTVDSQPAYEQFDCLIKRQQAQAQKDSTLETDFPSTSDTSDDSSVYQHQGRGPDIKITAKNAPMLKGAAKPKPAPKEKKVKKKQDEVKKPTVKKVPPKAKSQVVAPKTTKAAKDNNGKKSPSRDSIIQKLNKTIKRPRSTTFADTNKPKAKSDDHWINMMLEVLYPRLRLFIAKFLKDDLEPRIKKELSQRKLGMVDVQFTDVDIGPVPPSFGLINVIEENNKIFMYMSFKWDPNCQLGLKMLRIQVTKIEKIHVEGRFRIAFSPRIIEPPFFGGISVCLLNAPYINIDFQTFTNLESYDTIKFLFLQELRNAISQHIVYPNSQDVLISAGTDPLQVLCLAPTGLLAVQVVKADVRKVFEPGNVHKFISFLGKLWSKNYAPTCYATVSIGERTYQTPMVNDSQKPQWDDNMWFEIPLEMIQGHHIKIKLWDNRIMSANQYMGGVCIPLDEADLTGKLQTEKLRDDAFETLKEGKVANGTVSYKMVWVPVCSGKWDHIDGEELFAFEDEKKKEKSKWADTYPGKAMFVVTVFVDRVENIFKSPKDIVSTRLELKVGQFKDVSAYMNSMEPTFHKGYNFTFRTIHGKRVGIRLLDDKDFLVGECSVTLESLQLKPKRNMKLNLNDKGAKIVVSAILHTVNCDK